MPPRTTQEILTQILGSKDLQIATMQVRIEELEAQLAKQSAKPKRLPMAKADVATS